MLGGLLARWRLVLLGLCLVIGSGVAAWRLPDLGLHYGVIRALQSIGWPQVSMLDGSLSLFQGAVRIRQVQASSALGKALGLEGLDLTFRWKPLFSRRVSVAHLEMTGLTVDIKHQGDYLDINGLPIAIGGAAAQSEGLWSYDVTSLTLTNSRLSVTHQDHQITVQIDRLDLSDIRSWDPDKPAKLSLQGSVNGAPIRLDATATPFSATPSGSVRLDLTSFDLADLGPWRPIPLTGRISASLDLNGDMNRVAGTGRISLEKPALAQAPLTGQMDSLYADLTSLLWQRSSRQTELSGTLRAEGLHLSFGGLDLKQHRAEAVAEQAIWKHDKQTLLWDGQFHAETTDLSTQPNRLRYAVLDWSGKSSYDLSAQSASMVRGDGRLRLKDMVYDHGPISVAVGHLNAEGHFEHGLPQGMLPPLFGQATLSADQIFVSQPGTDWVRLASVTAHDLRLTKTHLSLKQAVVKDIAALAQPGRTGYPWRFEGRSLTLDKILLDRDGGLTLASIRADHPLFRIVRTKTGFVGLPHQASPSPAAPAVSSSLPALVIGKVFVQGGKAEFEDKSLSSPARLRVDGIEASLNRLDTMNSDQNSTFTAKARIGNAPLSAEGTVRLFQPRFGGDLSLSIQNLDLPVLSPYVQDMLGVFLNTGQLTSKVSIRAQNGALNGSMDMILTQLVMAQPGPETKLAKPPSLPVETVLDLLRNTDGRITLTIPISGDLTQPNFDLSDAIGQAIGGAVKSTLYTTLKVAFPLLALFELAIEEGGKSRLALEAVAFQPGSHVLDPKEQSKLTQVADLLRQTPSMTLTLCGISTQPQDGPALARLKDEAERGLLGKVQSLMGITSKAPQNLSDPDEDALLKLAASRAEAGKAFLVEKGKLDPGRIFLCRPQFDTSPTKGPRLDLML